jgi:photoactive yellow protein
LNFGQTNLLPALHSLSNHDLDQLDFGVIGFDDACTVRRYNAHESKASGLSPQRVLGLHFFDEVAVCMNNYLVAQRFEDAASGAGSLDDTIDYVLTLRMRPTPVRLRLLAAPGLDRRYVLVQRAL